MLKSILSAALFHAGLALQDISYLLDPEEAAEKKGPEWFERMKSREDLPREEA